tara:strand:- start:30223 stop:33963 length:3741 start_codon:yes stop_codon:yes gene_type:complete
MLALVRNLRDPCLCLCLWVMAQPVFASDRPDYSGSVQLAADSASGDVWERFRKIRRGETPDPAGKPDSAVSPDIVEPPRAETAVDTRKQQPEPATVDLDWSRFVSLMHCPDRPTHQNPRWNWYLCELASAQEPALSPYQIDMPVSFMTPADAMFNARNPARLMLFLHPDEGGSGSFVTGRSSYSFENNVVEIHNQEERYKDNPKGSWWGYSGHQVGAVANYNGRRMVTSVDYVLQRFGKRISLEKGIHLKGKSLGGAGVMHQALVLPKYRDKIAIVDSVIGHMNIPSCCRSLVSDAWGNELFESVDIYKQWKAIQHVHFHWRGGSNDSLGRFDPRFFDFCEARKISCSGTWLRSGHGLAEKGYSLDMSLFTDPNQQVTLDTVLPVITQSTANYHTDERGYHNRGITWNTPAIVETMSELSVPLQYIAMPSPGPGMPAQPEQVSFSVTPRHLTAFSLESGSPVQWRFGDQSGLVVADDTGLVTIDGLLLRSKAGYRELRLTRMSAPLAELDGGIVYTRVPRTSGPVTVAKKSGQKFQIAHPDVWDRLPESGHMFEGFNAPGQLVHRSSGGKERVLYDCVSTQQACVPLDAMVSPDASQVLFSVYRGERLARQQRERATLPNVVLYGATEAQLYVANLVTGKVTALAHTPGDFDVSPAWLPDGRIMFASTRNKTFAPVLNKASIRRQFEPQLYIANPDGTSARNVSPHEVATAMHPYVLQNGRIAYSSFWLSHNLAYVGNNGSINWPTTVDNMWMVSDIDHEGGDMTALLGAHRHAFQNSRGRTKTMKALHFLGQRDNGDICVSNYYRANNLGLGDVLCWPPEPKGVEGALPHFLPRGLYSVADWSKSNDEPSFTEAKMRIGEQRAVWLGKVGYPDGTPDGQLLLSYGHGYCTQIQATLAKASERRPAGSQLSCDVGIYKTSRIPSKSPADLDVVVDDPQWHEFAARVVRRRPLPASSVLRSDDGSCQLASSDAGSAETSPHLPYVFNKNYKSSANHGGEIDGLSHDELAGIRFYKVLPNERRTVLFRNSIGNELELLGDVKLLADKSFKVRLPCDTPYLMAGIDSDGRVIKRDQVPQSLRPGEKRVCSGCHLHSREGRKYESSMAFGTIPVDLTNALPVPTYTDNVQPLLAKKCVACHENDVPLMDYENLVWDYFQISVPDKNKVQVSQSDNLRRRFGLQRPYTSKYVNNMFARESLLYWKAAGKRTDGRTDLTYNDDIDFGREHPSVLSESELKLIGDWLDAGAHR